MTSRETAGLALLGFGIWLSGALTFRFGGRLMLESGPIALALSALGIALSVCLLLRATMDWRKIAPAQSVAVAVAMTLPGLFGDVAYVLGFSTLSGLQPATVGAYAAVVIFGTAVLYAYALVRART
jgi:hypothetical protein